MPPQLPQAPQNNSPLKALLQRVGHTTTIRIGLAAAVVLVVGGAGLFIYSNSTKTNKAADTQNTTTGKTSKSTPSSPEITSFAECKAAAGSKLSISTPQQCTTATGQSFTDTASSAPSKSKVATKTPASSTQKTGSSSKSGTSSGSSGSSGGSQSSGSGLNCANPMAQDSWPQNQYPGYQFGNGVTVGGDVMTGSGGSNSLHLNICSATNWNVVANLADQGGSINAYPDTEYDISGDKTIAQYASMQTCFGEKEPIPSGPEWPTAGGSEWDYAYDVWINHTTGEDTWSNDVEIMVWNDWTDNIYPPAVGSVASGGSRTTTIDGVAYHMFQGGGPNEWIYTRDTKALSGCFDMLNIMKDLVASESGAAGITSASSPQHLEYGVEIAGTYGTQTFQITNASLTVK